MSISLQHRAPDPFRWPVLSDALVLLVDPVPTTRASTAAVLSGAGACVLQAADGEQAMDLMRVAAMTGHPLDAVLLDVRASQVDGWVTARRLRNEPGGRRPLLPLFALVASDTPYARQVAELFGATGLVAMPCVAASLCDSLGEAIDLARSVRALRRVANAPAWSSWAANDIPLNSALA